MPLIGYKKRIHLMNHMIPSLLGGKGNKMSSSGMGNAKIDFLDSPDVVIRKINKASAFPKIVLDNPILGIVQHILFPMCEMNDNKGYHIERNEKDGANIVFMTYILLEEAYKNGDLHPVDLKNSVSKYINIYFKKLQPLLLDEDVQILYKECQF